MQAHGVYLFFGAEGSGKSTLAELLSKESGLPHVSSGRLVRAEEQKATLVGKAFRERAGAYVQDDLIIPYVLAFLENTDFRNGFIIEGFPRNSVQLMALKEFLTKKGLTLNKAIFVTLPENVSIERLLSRGREDDTEGKIAQRLKSYHEQESSLITELKKTNQVVEIDNSGHLDQTYDRLKELLND